MKTNLLKSIAYCIMMVFATPCLADGNDTLPSTPNDPFGDKIEIPIKGIKYQRSLNEPIEAYYYNNEYTIEIEFTENIGNIVVVIRNSDGVYMYNEQHNTATENDCTILLPAHTECYSIDITGSNYYGYGNICL